MFDVCLALGSLMTRSDEVLYLENISEFHVPEDLDLIMQEKTQLLSVLMPPRERPEQLNKDLGVGGRIMSTPEMFGSSQVGKPPPTAPPPPTANFFALTNNQTSRVSPMMWSVKRTFPTTSLDPVTKLGHILCRVQSTVEGQVPFAPLCAEVGRGGGGNLPPGPLVHLLISS